MYLSVQHCLTKYFTFNSGLYGVLAQRITSAYLFMPIHIYKSASASMGVIGQEN